MFIESVNAVCIASPLRCHTLARMEKRTHPSVQRLLEYARRATSAMGAKRKVLDYGDLATQLDVTSAVMTNWKARGIAVPAAVNAQRLFGCNVLWVLDGAEPQAVGGWPFPRVDRARWDACDDTDRGYVQSAMNRALDECEALRTRPHPGLTVSRNVADDSDGPVAGAKLGDGEVRASRESKKHVRDHNR